MKSVVLGFFRIATALFLLAASPIAASADTVTARQGQTVSTGGQGQQILFRDKTTLTAGPKTSVTVTRAEYKDDGSNPNVVIKVTKGAFRYVTGDQAGSHTIKTPLSTVGVRGTVIEGFVTAGGHEIFALVEGAFEVCTKKMCQQVTTPGTYVIVSPNGNVSPPMQIPSNLMNAMLKTYPSIDLINQHFAELSNNGGDPQVQFRDLNESYNGIAPLPEEPYMNQADCSDDPSLWFCQ